MPATFTETITLEKQECGKCGGIFALSNRFLTHARENKGGFHCPYCATPWSWSESNEDRLRKQLDAKEREVTAAKSEAMKERVLKEQAIAATAAKEKQIQRVHKGVCPCCNRSFTNLRRHMATKHPESVKKAPPTTP